MTVSRHTILATRSGHANGMDYDEEYTITFSYRPATPDRWYLRNGDPGYPGSPAEVEFISIEPLPEHPLSRELILDWVVEWFVDHEADLETDVS